jgi:eukaryotic-like serine/threonine-protein kinase
MSSLLGTTLGDRYTLEARIGAGGMSTVYRATDETLQRPVAVKLLNRDVADDEAHLTRFRREARAVAQLSHPNVVGVIDAGEDDGRPYIVFEYVDGETLKSRIRRLGQLPIADSVAYSIEIARALGAAHARHIIHRDVKPQNVMIDSEGSTKVTDFGIARTLEEDGLTADGRLLGTTDYVSPEQALGQPVTGQSDLYSLGIVLYEMLSGEVPFKGDNPVAVAMKHVRDPLPDVQAQRPEVSAALAAVIDRATAKQAGDRYATDADLISDLEDVLSIETARAGSASSEVTSVLNTLPAAKRRRVPFTLRHRVFALVMIGVAVLAAAGATAWLIARSHPQRQHHSTPVVLKIKLCATCAQGFNPLGTPTDETPNAQLAIDGNPTTAWSTQQYYSHKLGKAGTGLYVDTSTPMAVRQLRILTDTPGFTASIYARTSAPPLKWPDSGWVPVSASIAVASNMAFILTTHGHAYRYFLVWITSLGGQESVDLNEVKLLR